MNLQLRLHEASPQRKGQAKKLLKFTSQNGKGILQDLMLAINKQERRNCIVRINNPRIRADAMAFYSLALFLGLFKYFQPTVGKKQFSAGQCKEGVKRGLI